MNPITFFIFSIALLIIPKVGSTAPFIKIPNEVLGLFEHQDLLTLRSLNSEHKKAVQSIFESTHYQHSIPHAHWKKLGTQHHTLPLCPASMFRETIKKFISKEPDHSFQNLSDFKLSKKFYEEKLENIEKHIQDLNTFSQNFKFPDPTNSTEHEKLTNLFFKIHEQNIIEGFTTVQLFRAREKIKPRDFFHAYLSEIDFIGPTFEIFKKPLHGKLLKKFTTPSWHHSVRANGKEKSIWLQSLVYITQPTLTESENFDEYQISPSCYSTYKNNTLTIGHRINTHDAMFKDIEPYIQRNLEFFDFPMAHKLKLFEKSYELAKTYLNTVMKIHYKTYAFTKKNIASYKKLHHILQTKLTQEEASRIILNIVQYDENA